jgi:hypothetical protein
MRRLSAYPRLAAPLLATLLLPACGSGGDDGTATDSGTGSATDSDVSASVPTTTTASPTTEDVTSLESLGTDSATTDDTDDTSVPTTGPIDCDPALDDDDDGLTNGQECDRGTDPNDPDSDDDGALDGAEVDQQTDPLDPDSDDDGAPDGAEVDQQTDPLDPDSDDDGVLDGDETRLGTDPLDPDSDDDGLPDGDEVDEMTDPLDPDSDDDGLLDGDEVNYPKACVAADPADQRRDDADLPPACTLDADCLAGETCEGLDPLDADSDDDTLPDGAEDPNHDASFDPEQAETDPRLFDTDGDGSSDADSGVQLCQPDSQPMPPIVQIATEALQLAHDPAFTVTSVLGTRTAALLDDPATGVSGLVTAHAAGADLDADRSAVEAELRAALVAAQAQPLAVFANRKFTSHELFPAATSTFTVVKPGLHASGLRDILVPTLTGAPAPADQAVGVDPNGRYLLDITVVRRSDAAVDVAVTLAPETAYGDGTTPTAVRLGDLVNASGIAPTETPLDDACTGNEAVATTPLVDMLWTIDTSASTNDDQDRIGSACAPLLARMAAAGVDLRSGYFVASAGIFNLPQVQGMTWPAGFEFIPGTDAAAALTCARRVTSLAYSGGDNPNQVPFNALGGNTEEPIAAAILLEERLSQPDANPDYTWRPGARKVVFAFTDEPTPPNANNPNEANDWNRYFDMAINPDTALPFAPGNVYTAAVLQAVVDYFTNHDILLFGNLPPLYNNRKCVDYNVVDFAHCVVERTGHGTSDTTLIPADTLAGLLRVADALVGETSPYVLPRTPISATIRVHVGDVDVPRSKVSGFDYDPAARSCTITAARPQVRRSSGARAPQTRHHRGEASGIRLTDAGRVRVCACCRNCAVSPSWPRPRSPAPPSRPSCGIVTDKTSKQPIAGALVDRPVHLHQRRALEATTNASGAYTSPTSRPACSPCRS